MPRRTRRPPLVSLISLLPGCFLCLANGLSLANAAKKLLDVGSKKEAYALIISGFEEYGKALNLVKAGKVAEAQGLTKVNVKGFYSHSIKLKETMKRLDRSLLLLEALRSAIGHKPRFSTKAFRRHIVLLEESGQRERERAIYTDYLRKRWKRADCQVSKQNLKKDLELLNGLCKGLRQVLSKGRTFSEINTSL